MAQPTSRVRTQRRKAARILRLYWLSSMLRLLLRQPVSGKRNQKDQYEGNRAFFHVCFLSVLKKF